LYAYLTGGRPSRSPLIHAGNRAKHGNVAANFFDLCKLFGGWKQTLDGNAPTQLTDFKSNRIWSLALSRDGKQLAMSRGEARSDVAMISNFR